MTDRTTWAFIVGGCALLLGLFLQVPQIRYLAQPQSRGILVHLNSDEYQYLARLEEALTGRPEQAAQPYLGDPYAPGMHYALIEEAEGFLFGWTGFRAATVFQVMDTVIPALLFLAIFAFFRLSGFSRRRALGGAFLFALPLLYSLNRPVHQRESFLLVITTILLVILALERGARGKYPSTLLGTGPALWSVLSGSLLGLLVGVYLWAWMFAWIYVGLLFLWELMAWRQSASHKPLLRSRPGTVLLILTIGCVAASPFVLSILEAMRLPLYAEVAFRQGMYFTRLPESWIYSSLFLVMSVGLLIARGKYPALGGAKRYAILFPMAIFVAIDQQVIHGHVIAFTSHFTFAIALASVCGFLLSAREVSRAWGSGRIPWVLLPVFAASTLMIAAITWDNRHVLGQFSVLPGWSGEQHFATLLPVLDALPSLDSAPFDSTQGLRRDALSDEWSEAKRGVERARTRILSDGATSGFIASSTRHDIVSSIYLESAFLPSEEIAERWCLTVLPLPPAERRIGDQIHLVWPDADAANRGTDAREREVAMVEEACRRMDGDPAGALKRYGIAYVLWDQARQKTWDLTRLNVPLELQAEDPGEWALFRIIARSFVTSLFRDDAPEHVSK